RRGTAGVVEEHDVVDLELGGWDASRRHQHAVDDTQADVAGGAVVQPLTLEGPHGGDHPLPGVVYRGDASPAAPAATTPPSGPAASAGTTPRSVTIALTSEAGVTSKAQLRAAVPLGTSSTPPRRVTSSGSRSSMVTAVPVGAAGSIVPVGAAT